MIYYQMLIGKRLYRAELNMKSATDRLIEKLLSTGMNMTEVSHLLTRFMEKETTDYIDNIALRI